MIGSIVIYRTDGRNGLSYDLPAIITCTSESHPGDYPDGAHNPLPVPDEGCVHLTVFTPGGFGTVVPLDGDEHGEKVGNPDDEDFIDAPTFIPGSGTYVEWNVPYVNNANDPIPPRSWRWSG